jgi:hypothetical protein
MNKFLNNKFKIWTEISKQIRNLNKFQKQILILNFKNTFKIWIEISKTNSNKNKFKNKLEVIQNFNKVEI